MTLDDPPCAETLVLDGGSFFEAPRWHRGSWWASDMFAGEVRSVESETGTASAVSVEGRPSGLGWLPDGTMLVISMNERKILATGPQGSRVYADLAGEVGSDLNDMIVDHAGYAWVGFFGFDFGGGADPVPGGLLRIAPDGAVQHVGYDLMVPNGMVLCDHGTTLVVAETLASRLTAFTIGPDGTLSDRRTWAQWGPAPSPGTLRDTLGRLQMAPDGITVDREDGIWIADAIGGACHRVNSRGQSTDVVRAPEGLSAFACALGGPDGRTLVLCCAPDASAKRRRRARESILVGTEVLIPASRRAAGPPA
ncbi:SMP-30/gluconolactonase/LRE family protein [Sciscionella marina]|uniref:SMP-30/gluconolactonase/LRE family protein n=1 Tax=Sciscionella marina TaxID=508770 RepID=UPI00037932A1|nr:SMP-30/gluconolactonase/LRE family protein [Sciscionella marina]